MAQETIYLAYRTNEHHEKSSAELIYIGTDLEDSIAQLQAHEGMTPEQAEQVRHQYQSQCNNVGFEWVVKEELTNCFV